MLTLALVALIAPCVLGGGLVALAAGIPRRPYAIAYVLGAGWIVGILGCALLSRALCANDLSRVPVVAGSAAMLAGAIAWLSAWRLRKRLPVAAGTPERIAPAARVAIAFAMALLCVRAWLLATDIPLHPTLPWDAWAVWEAKAKNWLLSGHAAPYVDFGTWLQPGTGTRTSAAWSYPELLPWVLVWFSGSTGWLEPWLNFVWFGVWISLLLAHYGAWRALGIRAPVALAGVYALGSLPLIDAHVAMGGYADLWIAAMLSIGVHAWLAWRRDARSAWWIIVAAALVLLPMLKLEGAIWSIVLGAAFALGLLPRAAGRRRLVVGLLAAALAIVVCVVAGGAWIAVAERYVESGLDLDIRRIARSLAAIAQALWGQWNWSLLWFALPVAAVMRARTLRDLPTPRRLFAFLVVTLALVVGLFTFTNASRFAQSYSAVNRLLLQLVPLAVALLVMLVAPADERAQPSAAGSDDATRA